MGLRLGASVDGFESAKHRLVPRRRATSTKAFLFIGFAEGCRSMGRPSVGRDCEYQRWLFTLAPLPDLSTRRRPTDLPIPWIGKFAACSHS